MIMENMFEQDIHNALNKILQDSYKHINIIDIYPRDKSREVLGLLLDYACKGQTHAYINIARRLIMQIPHAWIKENFIPVASSIIDFNDDWEYRRMLEVTELLSQELLAWGVQIGQSSDDPEVKEASVDFEEKLLNPNNN